MGLGEPSGRAERAGQGWRGVRIREGRVLFYTIQACESALVRGCDEGSGRGCG